MGAAPTNHVVIAPFGYEWVRHEVVVLFEGMNGANYVIGLNEASCDYRFADKSVPIDREHAAMKRECLEPWSTKGIVLLDLPKVGRQSWMLCSPDIRHAVLGNAGTLISFRMAPEDAAYLAKEFQPIFDVQDLINMPNHNVYLKLMIDGEGISCAHVFQRHGAGGDEGPSGGIGKDYYSFDARAI